MKNRTGSRKASAGLAVILLAGAMVSRMGGAVGAAVASTEAGEVTLTQTAVWTDAESRKGAVQVEVTGLESLSISPGEPESDAMKKEPWHSEESFGETDGFTDGEPEAWEDTEESIERIESTEPEKNGERSGMCREPVFVMCLSEHFLLDESENMFPEGWSTWEAPVINREGRETTVTCISCPVRAKDSWELTVPVVLRREYRYPAMDSIFPVTRGGFREEEEMEKFPTSGTFIMQEKEGMAELLAYTEPVFLKLDAARADFSVSLEAQQEETKAGHRLYYQVYLENTGEIGLENISLTAALHPMEQTPLWERELNLEIEDGKAVVSSLARGEIKILTFSVKTEEGQSGAGTVAVTASVPYPGRNEENDSFENGSGIGDDGKFLVREAELPVVVMPLKAAFAVDKRADCEEAGPGDTITYRICIRNTGERTLHSVISTERFLHSNIRAQFEEKEGIELNSTKTQARIPQIPPGDCVNLKAQATLPQTVPDQKLINQVIVVSNETGESQAIRSQAEVKVQAEPTETPVPVSDGGDAQNYGKISHTSPKTGDRSHKEIFEALILCSVCLSAASSVRLFTAWRREGKGKRKH